MLAVDLRSADPSDAETVAGILRTSLRSLAWMPQLHTEDEDRAFVASHLLPGQTVTIAEHDGRPVGFIAIDDCWVTQLYLLPDFCRAGIGSRLLETATADMAFVQLYCFQANGPARAFYERHGFAAETHGDGASNEEGLPDILYVRRSTPIPGG